MRIRFATGADNRLFWNACALAQSFAEQNPGHTLQIANFGFGDQQSRFLERAGFLSSSPEDLTPLPHPWICKTALNRFAGLTAVDCDVLVWLDADMLAVGPIAQDAIKVAEYMQEHGVAAAACRDDGNLSLKDFIHVYGEAGMPVQPFDDLLAQFDVAGSEPYINTGFVMVADPSFWGLWHDLTSRIEPHVAYDQSTFNALVHSTAHRYLELDARSWNVHNGLIAQHEGRITPDGETIRLLHPTSMASEHHEWQPYTLTIEGHRASVDFKTFKRADLREQHLRALYAFISAHSHSLLSSGLLEA